MRNITEETRVVMNTRRNFVNYAHVTLHDGTELNLTPSDFRISGNSFTDDWNEGEAFQLGSAIGKTATLLLDNTNSRIEDVYVLQSSEPDNWAANYTDYYTRFDYEYLPVTGDTAPTWTTNTYFTKTVETYPHGKFSEYDFYMAYFELDIHLPKSTHYNGELIDEVIHIGTFTVTTPASHGATIEITGVDNMYMFDRPFDDCTLDFTHGQSLITILNRCCDDCGVLIGYTSFLNENLVVYKKPEGATYREIVSYIAQIAGSNAVISVSGALTLKYYDMSPILDVLDGGHFRPWTGVDTVTDTIDGGSFNPWTESDPIISGGNFTDPIEYHNLTATNGTTVSTDDIHFTGIMVSYEVESDGSTETQSLHYPDVTNWDDYAMQITDNPFITADNANTVITTVWDIIKSLEFRVFSCSSIQDPTIEAGDCALVYDVKGNIYPTIITNVTFKTGGMTDISCTAESPVKQNSRYVNPAAKAVAKAEQKMDAYNTQVARFNELAYASTAYYKVTKPSEPNVTYLCDQPTIEASTNVVKITGNGAFISTDGGESYNAGLDVSTATMLLNLLYVHGIECDWIHSGTLTLGGYGNINGWLKILNASGQQIGKWDADGISASNGSFSGSISGSTISASTITGTDISGANGSFTDGEGTLYLRGGALYMENAKDGGAGIFAYKTGGSYYACWGAKNSASEAGGRYREVPTWDVIEAGYNASDKRLKRNIKNLDDDFAKRLILGISPKQFEFKDIPDEIHFGVIAQDVKAIEDECGIQEKNRLFYIQDDGTYAVQYKQFIAPMIKVIQDQQAEIDDLKTRIEKLESIVNTNK